MLILLTLEVDLDLEHAKRCLSLVKKSHWKGQWVAAEYEQGRVKSMLEMLEEEVDASAAADNKAAADKKKCAQS